MKMSKITQSFTNKKFRYGAFSSLTAAVVIALLILINIVAVQFDIKLDLTSEKLYSIGDVTRNFISALDEEITIYALFKTGADEALTAQTLEQYAKYSDKITVIHRDPYVYPGFVSQYAADGEDVPVNSIIVVGSKRYKVIPASDLITYETVIDWETYTTSEHPDTLDIEPKVTNAIQYVISDNLYKVYQLTGHNETELPASFVDGMDDAGFNFGLLNLRTAGAIPEDCDVLVITTPEVDLNDDEAAIISEYLTYGGRVFFALDFISADFVNLNSLLAAYGVEYGGYLICEGDSSFYYPGYYHYIFPNMSNNEITEPLLKKGYFPLMIQTQSINTLPVVKSSTVITPLLFTTAKSYAKTNLEASTPVKEPGDLDGPFNVGVAVKDDIVVGGKSRIMKMVAVGTSGLFIENANQLVYGANSTFFVNSLNWLADRSSDDVVFITSKNLQTLEPLRISARAANILKVVCIGVIPGAVFVCGMVVWLRRRNR